MNAPTETVGLLVVGGGPAAHAAAAAYREHGGDGPVLLVSDDDTPPYFRLSLSKDFLRGESEADDLPIGDLGADVRLGRTVTALLPHDRLARLDDGRTVGYRRCVLATGAAPVRPSFPGADLGLYLRTLDDARRLRDRAAGARSAVVVGSGFIGCEAAVSLARRGLEVTICSAEPLPQSVRLGDGVGARLADWLTGDGVRFRGGAEVSGIETPGHGLPGDRQIVHLRDGDPVAADLVLVAAGITPRAGLAAAAGLAIERDRIVVDEWMRTTADHVLAAGDAVLARNAAAGRHLAVEHWDDAETMGRIAGATAAGQDAVWDSLPGFWTDIGDRTLQYTAWGDGYDEAAVTTHSGGGFTAWYRKEHTVVGVATHLADEDYERGAELVRTGARSAGLP
ncbi:FAD-dependent oxidoreductase [Pseudonocardia nematodicida]|uniref:FAD-dependent oxidoreductase n=1 Tax=Pseudonocardia nematodicida TaxID=1206997 RepID=A0ABV1KFX5_9PSEU